MNIEDIEIFSNKISGKLYFDYDLKKTNWFNIGGKSKIFFKPEKLEELIEFLKIYKNRGKIFIIGAGSNVLISDKLYDGAIIKLGRNFSKISLLNETTIIAGSSASDKQVSEFAKENDIGGFEYLSCIPGSVGGGIRMNTGCFNYEIKDTLVSVQAVNFSGQVITILKKDINFNYRECNLPKDLIFLSATFKGEKKASNLIQKKIEELKEKKEIAQPTKIKTGGSTFKNPKGLSNKKVWELINSSVALNTKFGDASISSKHCNFLVNKNNATFNDMQKLIYHIKNEVKKKTGIEIQLEIVLVE
tara:strand:- start:62 stop:970 length:909 start_codon:yes stop_codon:yes gene_type:complete